MIEVVGMLGMIMVGLAFVPVFKWLGRHYDKIEEPAHAHKGRVTQLSTNRNSDVRLN